jgi:hypothetical protein
MQFKEHIFEKVHSNLLHMNLRKEILALEIVVLMLYGFINIIGLKYNIKNDAVFCFVCFLFKKG